MDWNNMFNDEKPASPYADMFGGTNPQEEAKNKMKDLFAKALEQETQVEYKIQGVEPVKMNFEEMGKLLDKSTGLMVPNVLKDKIEADRRAIRMAEMMSNMPVGPKGETGYHPNGEKIITTPQKFATIAHALYTPEEQTILEMDPTVNPAAVIVWNKAWDNTFGTMSTLCNEQSNKMLDLTQDFAREHTKQNELFKKIQDCIREVDTLFAPKKSSFLGISFQGAPKEIKDADLHKTIDTVQKTLRNLQVKVDPFVESQLLRTIEGVEKIQRELGYAGLSLLIKEEEMGEDLYNRRLIRLESLKKIVELSSIGIGQLSKQVKHRVEVLEDFKMQAVPMVILKLQQFIMNKDATALQGAFDNILNLRLE